ncbi:hypothetical protein DQQ10_04070 [Pseudochryseolinea flava]|uniref:Outer membrane protein beta-barrel domain-containing protein n=1 Tax=Pseudochryseolinea flava TaxID=2059302 RepID=A0A364YAA9_9BACT|nr:hypothetical protein DQQ10_04070 [Pseudochryseolinea flava]
MPTTQNNPMLSKQGDAIASVSSGISGTGVQGAIAATNHFAFTASGMYADNSIDNEGEFRKHKAIEFGFGYFRKGRAHFDIFGGMGWAKGEATIQTWGLLSDSYEKQFSGEYKKYFLQSSLGLSRRYVEGAISTRLTAIRFSTLHYAEEGESIWVTKKPRVFFEPAFTFRVFPGARKFFFVGQASLSLFMNKKDEMIYDDDYNFRYEPLHLSVGAGFKFGRNTD